MTVIAIQIISDTICPWCYIGFRRLQKAIDLYKKTYPGGSKDTIQIEWKPFYLNPDAPTEGVLIQERMVTRMGPTRTLKTQSHMSALARAEGIEIKYGARTGNTSLSHQLLHYARSSQSQSHCNSPSPSLQTEVGRDLQTDLALELFRLHFSEERDITSLDTMLEAAVNSGLDAQEVQNYLEAGAAKAAVDAEAALLREEGVKGVPRFGFLGGEKEEVDGAGDVMEFFEILVRFKEGAVVGEV